MSTARLFLLSSSALGAAAAIATCPGGIYGLIATDLAGYAPASSYCLSKYPLSTVTSIIVAPTSTSITTAVTVTQTITAVPATTTATAATQVVVQTEQDSVTVTVPAAKKLRRRVTTTKTSTTTTAKTTATTLTKSVQDARQRAFSSLLSSAQAFVSTVCVCIEGPAKTISTTTTPIQIVTATATNTVTTTPTNTITTTPITLTTTTVTSTATATAAPANPANNCQSGQQCLYGYLVQEDCNVYETFGGFESSNSGVASFQQCASNCAADSACISFNYDYNNQVCNFYTQSTAISSTPSTQFSSGSLIDYC